MSALLVEVDGGSTLRRHAVELLQIVRVLVPVVNDAAAVIREVKAENVAPRRQRLVELDWRSSLNRHAVQLSCFIRILIGPIDNSEAVWSDLKSAPGHVTAGDKLAVEFQGRATLDGHAVQLEDVVDLLIGPVDDPGSVGARSEIGGYSAAGDKRPVELDGRAVLDGHTVQLEDVICILVRAIDDPTAIGTDHELIDNATLHQRPVELQGRAALNGHTKELKVGDIDHPVAIEADRVVIHNAARGKLNRVTSLNGYTVQLVLRVQFRHIHIETVDHEAAVRADRKAPHLRPGVRQRHVQLNRAPTGKRYAVQSVSELRHVTIAGDILLSPVDRPVAVRADLESVHATALSQLGVQFQVHHRGRAIWRDNTLP
ncbi:MAG: hypothetical protein PVG32_15620 [Anaerolineales bacterium]